MDRVLKAASALSDASSALDMWRVRVAKDLVDRARGEIAAAAEMMGRETIAVSKREADLHQKIVVLVEACDKAGIDVAALIGPSTKETR